MNWNWKGVLQAANQYGMDGYRPGTPQAPQGYVPYEATLNQRGLPNNMQPDNSVIPGTTYQPDNFGNRQPEAVTQMEAEQQAQQQAQQKEAAKQKRIKEIEAEIAAIEQSIAERKRGMAANEDALNTQLAAIEARKINQKDPTSIWRWKAQMDENRRIANAQNKTDNTAKANALIDANNTLDSMIIDENLDTPTKNAMLSKLADVKSSLEKNGFDTTRVNSMISKLKGNGPQTPREQAKTTWRGLQGKKDLTSAELDAAINDPNMKWDPNDLEDAKNLSDKLKKHEAATQSVKDMKADYKRRTGKDFDQADPYIQQKEQERWKRRNKK